MTEEKEKKEVERETPTEEKGQQESPKEKAVKEPPKEEKKEEPSKDKEKKQPPKEEVKEAAAPEGKTKKRKKINRMKLEEIEKRLGELQGKSGGMNSLYAQHLLERQKELQAPKEASLD
ncbi:MAG: hypothetical protein U9Q24_02910 [Candidatus Ratteibacteria bacterium]|nr:hypothetical protein [Candidatus Ratteibacteria bacterium]